MRLLVIILVFFYAFYLLSKYVFPYLLKRYIQKAQRQYNEKYETKRPEGDVSVNYVPPKAGTNKYNPETIEDVDFEEIKEK